MSVCKYHLPFARNKYKFQKISQYIYSNLDGVALQKQPGTIFPQLKSNTIAVYKTSGPHVLTCSCEFAMCKVSKIDISFNVKKGFSLEYCENFEAFVEVQQMQVSAHIISQYIVADKTTAWLIFAEMTNKIFLSSETPHRVSEVVAVELLGSRLLI